jgi:hypothetical protein
MRRSRRGRESHDIYRPLLLDVYGDIAAECGRDERALPGVRKVSGHFGDR